MANKVLITARPPELAPGLLLTCLLLVAECSALGLSPTSSGPRRCIAT